ncbi:MAG: hypothetical protein WCJ30_22425, partial [Deltaproteobacteria bacterium]
MSRDESPVRTVVSLRDGESVRVVGVVRAANGPLLQSGSSQRACVYWDEREWLEDPPIAHGTVAFWLEDATGRVLIAGDPLEVDARTERRKAVLAAVDADLATLTTRLRKLKALRRGSVGTKLQGTRSDRPDAAAPPPRGAAPRPSPKLGEGAGKRREGRNETIPEWRQRRSN